MQTFRHIFRTEQETIKSKARECYGFDAFYSWFLQTYAEQMTEYEQDNMAQNIPALRAVFESNSTFHRQYHRK